MTDVKALWHDRVAQIEARSGAEVVVAVQSQAGSYVDVHWKWTTLAMTLTLGLMIYSPFVFNTSGLLLNVLFAGLLGYLSSWRLPPLRRWLTTGSRRQKQVSDSTLLAFERLRISHTRQRVGLLLLVSWFENRALLRPDVGLTGRVPGAVWNRLQQQLDEATTRVQLEQAVTRVLEELVEPLHQGVPLASDDQNELSNEVRTLC